MNEKTFIIKSAVFLILLLFSAIIIEHYIYDFPELNKLKKDLKEKDIIYFGDSVIRTADINDLDKKSIASILDSLLNQYTVSDLSHAAYHLEVYEAYSEYICSQNTKPKYIILPINLKSLRPSSISNPRYQFEIEISLLKSQNPLKNLWDRFFYLLYLNGERTQKLNKNWEQEKVLFNNTFLETNHYFSLPVSKDDTNLNEKLSNHVKFSYLYNLKKDNKHIKALNNTLQNYKECKIPVIIYITPNDYQAGQDIIGQDYIEIVKKNKIIIEEISTLNGYNLLDMSFDLDSSYFSYPLIPNEHLNEHGRRYIAIQIKDEILERE